MRRFYIYFFCSFLVLSNSCYHERTGVTGWEYNEPDHGGFQRVPFYEQEDPPDMALIEGKIIPFSKDTKRDTLNSFYISKYEETNGQYMTYVQYIKKYYSDATYKSVLPDTTVWKNENFTDTEKDYLIKNYFRDPAYKNFPVVGVSPQQIERYAWWKTDRMNEFILVREGIFTHFEDGSPDWMVDSTDIFTTLSYLSNTYYPGGDKEQKLIDLNPEQGWSGQRFDRSVRMEDGILMPRYRMLLLKEWQHAANAIGDAKNHYPKTDKFSLGKYDKTPDFSHLKIQIDKKNILTFAPVILKIGRVYDHAPNNYKICGMASGVSEFVKIDSLSFCVVGGSWKMEEDHSAVYQKESGTYQFPKTFVEPAKVDSKFNAVAGFRLAMDRLGPPYVSE